MAPNLVPPTQDSRKKLTLDRTYKAPIEKIWALWTTKEGIEAWWGPDGFVVEVRRLDLRPGGELEYTMAATGPDQIDYMKKAGMPLKTEHQITFTEIVPRRRLAYTELADFIPGVKPYDVKTLVEFDPRPDGIRMLLTFEAMHDDHWTRLAVMGRESELARLAKILEKKA